MPRKNAVPCRDPHAWLPSGSNGEAVAEARDRLATDDWQLTGSVALRRVNAMINQVATTDATVLVWGESGSGKEVVARAVHARSPRRLRPLVKVNCAALPLELLESELFGHERGAFTGAYRAKPGKFELADAGTIFLDEIGDLPWALQAKLLQVLQDCRFSRLGSRHDIEVDARVVAATNQNLRGLVDLGRFREDLYYRLNVVAIRVPPLRERREEIPILVQHFVKRYSEQYRRPRSGVASETLQRFTEYRWPGNLRELENIVKRIVVLGTEDWVAEELAASSGSWPIAERAPAPSPQRPRDQIPLDSDAEVLGLRQVARRAAHAAERAALEHVLEEVRWNRVEAARRLKVNYKTLLNKIAKCGLAR